MSNIVVNLDVNNSNDRDGEGQEEMVIIPISNKKVLVPYTFFCILREKPEQFFVI